MAAVQAQARTKVRTRRRNGSTARRKSTLSNARNTIQRAVSDDVAAMRAEVDDMIASLEQRIGRINALTKQGAGHAADGINELVLNAISGLTGQVADRAKGNAMSMSDEVARMGSQALRRVVREIDRRPLLTVAIAAGIGFVVAMARRPE
jgi:ElaB/YqjD/DUF883 family membrane-anchored ribosome-binding protein